MKKTVLIFVALMAIGMGAYAQKGMKAKKVLVTYFSATGVTKAVAQQLAEVADADLYEITPAQLYTADDLDWRNKQSRSSVEMKDKSSRPAIKGSVKNMQGYETVYIGFPIWWNTCPRIINTFIEAHDLKGKAVIPFATSGSSSISNSCSDLKRTYPDIDWKEGKLLNGVTKQDLEKWVK